MFERRPASTIEPELSEWGPLLESATPTEPQLREVILTAAYEYSSMLSAVAKEVGLTVKVPQVLPAPARLIMAGHQPVIYHPGLVAKTSALSRSAQAFSCNALNILVDHDGGAATELRYPSYEAGFFELKACSFNSHHNLYKNQVVQESRVVQESFRSLYAGLMSSKLDAILPACRQAEALYCKLGGVPVSVANSLVRTLSEPPRNYFELPLSQLICIPDIKAAVQRWIQGGKEFAQVYNLALEHHREVRKIKNPANPFPNLKIEDGTVELPAWSVDYKADQRASLWMRRDGQISIKQLSGGFIPAVFDEGVTLTPRGAMITLLFRGLCCDLFVHGLGGRTYDTFTTAYGHELLGRPIAPFAVVSASNYLFGPQLEQYEKAAKLESMTKELVARTDELLQLFDADLQDQLLPLIAERKNFLAQLASTEAADRKSAIGKELRRLNDKVRESVIIQVERARSPVKDIQHSGLQAWYCREYPAFFFPPNSL